MVTGVAVGTSVLCAVSTLVAMGVSTSFGFGVVGGAVGIDVGDSMISKDVTIGVGCDVRLSSLAPVAENGATGLGVAEPEVALRAKVPFIAAPGRSSVSLSRLSLGSGCSDCVVDGDGVCKSGTRAVPLICSPPGSSAGVVLGVAASVSDDVGVDVELVMSISDSLSSSAKDTSVETGVTVAGARLATGVDVVPCESSSIWRVASGELVMAFSDCPAALPCWPKRILLGMPCQLRVQANKGPADRPPASDLLPRPCNFDGSSSSLAPAILAIRTRNSMLCQRIFAACVRKHVHLPPRPTKQQEAQCCPLLRSQGTPLAYAVRLECGQARMRRQPGPGMLLRSRQWLFAAGIISSESTVECQNSHL